jgi:hypothetical protein
MAYEHGSPRALIHGPLEMGGCEIPHIYTEMLGLKIESIISHICADSILGKSFRININYLQLLSGLEQPIFPPGITSDTSQTIGLSIYGISF